MDLDAYFKRIGFDSSKAKVDLETLTEIFQCQLRTVHFENLDLHLGKTMVSDLEAAYDLVVNKNRGGWCLQINALLNWALTEVGFQSTILGGQVYNPPAKEYREYMSHMVLKVSVDGKDYLVDAGFGLSFQTWEPLELISGKEQHQTPSVFRLLEKGGVWHVEQRKRDRKFTKDGTVTLKPGGDWLKIFNFTLTPRVIDDFEPASKILQVSQDDEFATNSICSAQTVDGVESLVGHTLTFVKYNKDGVDSVEIKRLTTEEVNKELKERFKIYLDMPLKPKKRGEEDVLI